MSRSCWRVMSPVGASSLITSAPSQARSWVQDGPDCTCVMSSTRTPSRALVIRSPPLLVRSLVHRLVHGSGRIRVRVDPHVDERGQPRLAGPLHGRPDLLGVPDLLAVPAEHLGELVVLHVAERVPDPAAVVAVLGLLAVADLVHRRVV